MHLAFTGILTTRRSEAALAAKRAGAIVHGGPSAQTTVVVRGRPNALQAAGRDAGRKLMEIKRLREKGHRITLLSEATVLAAGRTKSGEVCDAIRRSAFGVQAFGVRRSEDLAIGTRDARVSVLIAVAEKAITLI